MATPDRTQAFKGCMSKCPICSLSSFQIFLLRLLVPAGGRHTRSCLFLFGVVDGLDREVAGAD
jgi:hypothetical protein